MTKRKISAILVASMMATCFIACGQKSGVVSTPQNESTTASATETTGAAKTMTPSEQISSKQASVEEDIKKAKEEAESKAKEAERAAKEEESREAAKRAEEESKAAALQAEIESKAAELKADAESKASEAEEITEQAATSGKSVSSDDAIITVVDTYGVESAKRQYAANYEIYMELIRLTNELRESLGVAPLQVDETICIASCKKAVDYYLADYYDGENHTMIDGRKWTAILDDFNISCTSRAENLAKGNAFMTAKQMFEGWKNSPIHYENMVNPKYTRIGVGSCGYVWFMDLTN